MLESKKLNYLDAVIIKVKNEKYLLEVKNVKEIFIPGEKVVPIPLADKNVVGIIDIRGEIYTIISLKQKIYKKHENIDIDENSRILLLELPNLKIAILVDSVIGVKKLPLSIFETRNTIVETQVDYRFIRSVGIMDGSTYILLDLDVLIPPELIALAEETANMPQPIVNRRKTTSREIETEVDDTNVEVPRLPKLPEKSKKKELIQQFEADQIKLSNVQEDTLKEIGNIGSGNAVTALSRLIKKKVDVDLTDVGIVSFETLADTFGDKNRKVCGIFCNIQDSDSTILQAFEMKPLLKIVASLAGKDSKMDPEKTKSKKDLDDFAISTIKEMGNIMAGHYASALSDLTGMKMMLDLPEFTLSSVEELQSFLTQEMKIISKLMLLIKTSIKIVDLELNGVFFFIPNMDTLSKMFMKLGVENESLIRQIDAQKGMSNDFINTKDIDLTNVQKDALQEVGNIGAGNAANALAKLMDKRVDINIPSVQMLEIEKFAKSLSKGGSKLTVSWSHVTGRTRATVLSIFEIEDMIDLTSIIIDDEKKKQIDLRRKISKIDDLPDIYQDAMKETTHILASHYASALGDLLDIRLMTEPPDMSIDNGSELFEILKEEIGLLKKLSLVIDTKVIITDIEITGSFLFIPEISTLNELLDALAEFYE
ncbi:MAG: hypothetical protein GF317_06750 [Candidatus Lokiarchaeota archaeon]|nr:hypothetical protein [Candidatus Lokiarchaeota archaeon]MBD3199408.1 hypothetical protein [Candidatus Lokiarchaeota archaeon]